MLPVTGERRVCSGCHITYHEDCIAYMGRCPTPGCGRTPSSERVERPRDQGSSRALLVTVLVLAGVLAAIITLIILLSMSGGGSGSAPDPAASTGSGWVQRPGEGGQVADSSSFARTAREGAGPAMTAEVPSAVIGAAFVRAGPWDEGRGLLARTAARDLP